MYPVAPATDQYVLGSPLFKKATISLQNGKTFTIVAPENNGNNVYVSSAKLNNIGYSKNFLNYNDVMKGGTLNLMMSPKPNKTKGIADSDFPYSMTNELKK
jgi:putative alpha-1,2-mannosidase